MPAFGHSRKTPSEVCHGERTSRAGGASFGRLVLSRDRSSAPALSHPQLHIVLPRFDRYLRFSRMAREIYADYSDLVETFGLDEVWWRRYRDAEVPRAWLESLENEIHDA